MEKCADNSLLIDSICYTIFHRESQSVNDMISFCENKGMSIAEFSSYKKLYIFSFISRYIFINRRNTIYNKGENNPFFIS